MNKNTRLFRPRPPEEFTDGKVARYDQQNNIVIYNMEMFDLRNSWDFGELNRFANSHMLATTE
jgi:hypothetical protein